MLFSPLVERAMRVASRWHRNHERKASDLPYITHPASVALILIKVGFDDDEILAAALLHDVVEDTACTLDQLAAQFPPKVVEYVAASTERKRDSNGNRRNWHDRKQEHILHVAEASLAARAIVLADKLHNLGTMLYDLEAGEDIWSRFGASPDNILSYYRAMIAQTPRNDDRLLELAGACQMQLERLKATVESMSLRPSSDTPAGTA